VPEALAASPAVRSSSRANSRTATSWSSAASSL